ncbi:DUF397 domain-containing protein [Sphaerisporangium sp. NPDC051017]|uniref:DUF397 domain-containing protein n=1 Tax=Sphaerisporangium sp. NPDC051017 TaxID=3154636 RepID=UPI00342FE8C4
METFSVDLSGIAWRKSSMSGSGQNCIEVGVWCRSSRSNANGGQCVEVGVLHKSTHRGVGPNCIEVTCAAGDYGAIVPMDARYLYLVRDSKNADGPVLAVNESEWSLFLEGVKADRFIGPA